MSKITFITKKVGFEPFENTFLTKVKQNNSDLKGFKRAEIL